MKSIRLRGENIYLPVKSVRLSGGNIYLPVESVRLKGENIYLPMKSVSGLLPLRPNRLWNQKFVRSEPYIPLNSDLSLLCPVYPVAFSLGVVTNKPAFRCLCFEFPCVDLHPDCTTPLMEVRKVRFSESHGFMRGSSI